MRKRISINEPNTADYQRIKTSVKQADAPIDLAEKNPLSEIIAAERNGNFVNYLEWLGLDKDPNLVILSSMHHYYYDAEEMKNVKTVVNLIELNQIKETKDFLHSIFHILSPKSNFVGCFVDSKKQNLFRLRRNPSASESIKTSLAVENGILSRIPFLNRLYSLIDYRTNKYLTKNNVTLLLEECGFKALDFTEIDGLTYFHAKKALNTGS